MVRRIFNLLGRRRKGDYPDSAGVRTAGHVRGSHHRAPDGSDPGGRERRTSRAASLAPEERLREEERKGILARTAATGDEGCEAIKRSSLRAHRFISVSACGLECTGGTE